MNYLNSFQFRKKSYKTSGNNNYKNDSIKSQSKKPISILKNKKIKIRNNLNILSDDLRTIMKDNNSTSTKKSEIIENNNLNNESITKKEINYYKCNLFNNLNKINFEEKKTSNKTNKYRKDKYKICQNISFSYIPNFEKINNCFNYNRNIINASNYQNIKSLNIIKEIINIQNDIIFKSKEKEKKLKKEINLKMNEIKQLKEYYLKFIYYISKENDNTLDKIKKCIEIQRQLFQENKIIKQILFSNKPIIKKDENKENIFKLLFERRGEVVVERSQNKLLNKNKNNSSKEKKDLIKKMLNKEKIKSSPLNSFGNSDYDYFGNISSI